MNYNTDSDNNRYDNVDDDIDDDTEDSVESDDDSNEGRKLGGILQSQRWLHQTPVAHAGGGGAAEHGRYT